MSEKPTLVIGDVHGHLDRIEALLAQESVTHALGGYTVVQLGDLGHFGGASGTPTGDLMCWQRALEGMVDLVLWGNHDRAVVDPWHAFAGFQKPDPEALHIIRLMEDDGRLKFAAAAHGVLITHAGLHEEFKNQPDVDIDKTDPYAVADYINGLVDESERRKMDGTVHGNRAIIDAIGRTRGGSSPFGGILWRDYREALDHDFPQVFGHSAQKDHQIKKEGNSWCIDVGGKGDKDAPEGACLAGIWLPEMRTVRVDL